MQGELIQEEERLEAEYWWFVGRRSIIHRLLRRFRVNAGLAIDVGCGSGRNLEVLTAHARSVAGVDCSAAAVRLTAARGFAAIQADGNLLPLADGSIDLLTGLDVLERAARWSAPGLARVFMV